MLSDAVRDACIALEEIGVAVATQDGCSVAGFEIRSDGSIVREGEKVFLHVSSGADDIVLEAVSLLSGDDLKVFVRRSLIASVLSGDCGSGSACHDAERLFALGFTDREVCERVAVRDLEYGEPEASAVCSIVESWRRLIEEATILVG